ncbi:uncharacterized protein LOC107157222 [Marmota marmota marmota]|uniref:uncharacterized protein LOC107157222 n=1 Tax=Marmota marmota marmota TaxID=9994 RepID=UPI002093D97C|nr:uncharacterized protein LOC107157222 [Marmota marmota marmota]
MGKETSELQGLAWASDEMQLGDLPWEQRAKLEGFFTMWPVNKVLRIPASGGSGQRVSKLVNKPLGGWDPGPGAQWPPLASAWKLQPGEAPGQSLALQFLTQSFDPETLPLPAPSRASELTGFGDHHLDGHIEADHLATRVQATLEEALGSGAVWRQPQPCLSPCLPPLVGCQAPRSQGPVHGHARATGRFTQQLPADLSIQCRLQRPVDLWAASPSGAVNPGGAGGALLGGGLWGGGGGGL